MLKEFKAFAMRGNVVDLAVGVIIGGAFGKIVGSLIDDVITPLLLKPALEAQLKRLQVNENGFNYVEQKLLDIYNYGFKTRHEIYRKFWETEKIYLLRGIHF